MNNKKTNFKLAIIIGMSFMLIGILYSSLAAKIYQVDTQVLLMRNKFDIPEIGTEESRNRWIWIRDGLNLKSLIISDLDLNKFIESKQKNSEVSMIALKKMIDIQYTGADDNNYIITVKGSDKNFIMDLSKHLFERIKFLAIEKSQDDYSNIIERLKKDSLQFTNNSIEQSNYQAQIRKITLAQSLDIAQKQSAFQIIQLPTLKDDPIWPRTKIIVLTLGILGFVIGLFIEMGIVYYRNNE